LGTALNNLALAAANDTTVLHQLTYANLALTATNAALTTANKKLSEALAKLQATKPSTPGPPLTSNKPFLGNYCVNQEDTGLGVKKGGLFSPPPETLYLKKSLVEGIK
jgi:hypothetical protein